MRKRRRYELKWRLPLFEHEWLDTDVYQLERQDARIILLHVVDVDDDYILSLFVSSLR